MRATILCYHKVGPLDEEGRSLNIAPERLRAHAAYFSRHGRRFLLAKELSDQWPPGAICFTFDDAYVSALERVPEIFGRLGQRATFYAVAGLVGTSSSWDGEKARPLADWDALRAAQYHGHEIGNHSTSHPFLEQLSVEAQESELAEADRRLRDEGLEPASICYPYGSYAPSTVEVARRLGYRVGVSLRKGLASERDDRLVLPRIAVAYSDSLPALLYKVKLRPFLRRRA